MKQFWLVATAVVLLTTLLSDEALAQRGSFRGAAIGGGGTGSGFRGAAIGGGFRGKVGPGFRGAGFRHGGWGGPGGGWGGGWGSPVVVGGGYPYYSSYGYPYYGSTIPCIVTEGRKFGFGCP
jgi:hypothetical protein